MFAKRDLLIYDHVASDKCNVSRPENTQKATKNAVATLLAFCNEVSPNESSVLSQNFASHSQKTVIFYAGAFPRANNVTINF